MDINYINKLNKSQQEAIKTIDGPLLILAGAGSGKTKTITSRLAYLIDEVGIPPASTLTLTFTNKAAQEMQQRALNLIENKSSHPPLLCTFHKFGLLFLKFYIHLLERKANFVLLDSDDTKKILKEFNQNIAPLPLLTSEISRMKNSKISPKDAINFANNDTYQHIAKVYNKYQEFLLQNNRVDFDDLLLLPLEILENFPKIATEVSQKYQYIMVDEYQDTNYVQYLLLKHLCTTHDNICVVGDDDQSIYSWRGATIENILNFTKYFKNAKSIKLEENYRSTKSILDAANKLISHNKERLGKNLKSTKEDGTPIKVLQSFNAKEEVAALSKIIKSLFEKGVDPKDIAILFRLNALSRSLEEGFNRENIPYTLIGTIRFYERSEIKDVLSYFRVLINLEDDFSLLRIINKPKRGIGKTTLEKLQNRATMQKCSIFSLFQNDIELQEIIGKKAYNTIQELFKKLQALQEYSFKEKNFLDEFEKQIGLCQSFSNNNDEVDRIGNIEEFYGLYNEYLKQNPFMELEDFLNELALKSDQEDLEERNKSKGINGVSCMSVHSSKGLEFDYVFIIGLEEGFFPMIKEDSSLEEERRLGYVAFTRAKKELYLSFSDSRFFRGKEANLPPSRFLKECGVYGKPTSIAKTPLATHSSFRKGDCVSHKILGMGRIVEITQNGKEIRLKINFGGLVKEILSDYVKPI
ncbi:ATP-dependent helicase [Helicobacter burdigaliensis]|uniref:ATP-dependent helicase n=1 Tax=Helicobacter burdigaliensis TaxID=2315334 RepID=UPI000EF6E6F0|nr:UvrD-helicase domain-containing protein [Helicobacter burdigaliensis]